jgi:hypothetical protein
MKDPLANTSDPLQSLRSLEYVSLPLFPRPEARTQLADNAYLLHQHPIFRSCRSQRHLDLEPLRGELQFPAWSHPIASASSLIYFLTLPDRRLV